MPDTQAINTLNSILGKPLRYIKRCSDMIDIGFGDMIKELNSKGKTQIKPEFAIHIQCPFRVIIEGSIVVGSEDIYIPQNTSEGSLDLDALRSTRFDVIVESLNSYMGNECVNNVILGSLGDITIELTKLTIQALVVGSSENEDWRFLELTGDKKHLVRYGKIYEII